MRTRPNLDFKINWVPKRGYTLDEYEDASAVDSSCGRFAIADGATESSFTKVWAELLVNQFIVSPVRWRERWRDWLPPLQKRWLDEVGNRPLPWYAESKFEQGAFSTFLGLLIEPRNRRRWWAVAVGDCCLFQLRDQRLITKFPLAESTEFGIHPNFVGSRTPFQTVINERERCCHGECRAGDRFYLASDALAHWFLKQQESGEQPWQAIKAACQYSTDHFISWIEHLRDSLSIRNDDVTLVTIDV